MAWVTYWSSHIGEANIAKPRSTRSKVSFILPGLSSRRVKAVAKPALPITEPFNNCLIDGMVAPASDVDAWPPLPINVAPGFGLEMSITQSGPITAQSQTKEIMKDIDGIDLDI